MSKTLKNSSPVYICWHKMQALTTTHSTQGRPSASNSADNLTFVCIRFLSTHRTPTQCVSSSTHGLTKNENTSTAGW